MIIFGVKYCDECDEVICPGERFLQLTRDMRQPRGPENLVHFHQTPGRECFFAYLERRLEARAISEATEELDASQLN